MLNTLALAALVTVDALPPAFSTPLLTWTGLVAVVVGLMLWGLLIPRSSHIRELRIQQENHDKVVAVLLAQVADKNAEIGILRTVVTTEQSTNVELLAQHRMSIETNRASVYAIEGFRDGLVRAQREAQT